MAEKKKKAVPQSEVVYPTAVPEPKSGLMDRTGLLIYQGVITLVVLIFMLLGLQQVQRSVDKANETLICVLSIPPDLRTPENLKTCE